jgi:hypothetical protein
MRLHYSFYNTRTRTLAFRAGQSPPGSTSPSLPAPPPWLRHNAREKLFFRRFPGTHTQSRRIANRHSACRAAPGRYARADQRELAERETLDFEQIAPGHDPVDVPAQAVVEPGHQLAAIKGSHPYLTHVAQDVLLEQVAHVAHAMVIIVQLCAIHEAVIRLARALGHIAHAQVTAVGIQPAVNA